MIHTAQRKSQKNAKSKKSSQAARDLIRAYIKHYGTGRKAANALGIPYGQLTGVLSGRLHDTPAIIVALAMSDRRAKRARYMLKPVQQICTIDACATLHALRRELEAGLTMIDTILRQTERKQS